MTSGERKVKVELILYKINGLEGNEETIQTLLDCSNCWFGESPENPEVAPSQFAAWSDRMHTKCGIIYYCTKKESGIESIAGFLFSYIRDTYRHIWIAATNPTLLRCGVMSRLFQMIENENIGSRLTVNTYPDRFVNMPHFLDSRGFQCYDIRGQQHRYSKEC